MNAECRRSLHAPDRFVMALVIVLRVIQVIGAAVGGDIVAGDQMRRGDLAGRRLLGEGAVEFVQQLPTVQLQGLRHRRRLAVARADTLVSGD